MKPLCLVVALMAGPASAEGDVDQGLRLLQQGSKLLMQRLIDRFEPDLRALALEMGPALLRLQGMVGDLSNYHAPELLPNGDIILRRKLPVVPALPVLPGGEPEGDIEL